MKPTKPLAPCPFCAGTDFLLEDEVIDANGHYWCVLCDEHDCQMRGPYADTPDMAQDAWNRRLAAAAGKVLGLCVVDVNGDVNLNAGWSHAASSIYHPERMSSARNHDIWNPRGMPHRLVGLVAVELGGMVGATSKPSD